ncbi:hypothetical protein [Lentibacillus cibarius]|uniref:hypothetical protein n=1 Tax=Lentibacillus cibarius TaxID=2583219 RepID=UPI00163DE1B5|nr:hypothetical protein [Lentibacillus cibarius]
MKVIKKYEENGKRHTVKRDGGFVVHVSANEPTEKAVNDFNRKFNLLAEEI